MRSNRTLAIRQTLVPRLFFLSLVCLSVSGCGTLSSAGKADFSYKDMPIADGSAVAFVSNTPLLPSDANTLPDVYLRVLR